MAEGLVIGHHHHCAHQLKLEAHERLTEMQFENIKDRLDHMEDLMHRLEKRLWLAVYGVAAVILAQAFQSIMAVSP